MRVGDILVFVRQVGGREDRGQGLVLTVWSQPHSSYCTSTLLALRNLSL